MRRKTFLFAWGRGEDGQLGLHDDTDHESPIMNEHIPSIIGIDDDIKLIFCGSAHSAALTKKGRLFTWGRGDDGRLGHGINESIKIPRLVQSFATKRMIFVTCGSYHTAAVSEDGELFTWGGGMYGKLGHGTEQSINSPKKVNIVSKVRQVACGSRHTLCLTEDCSIFSWGEKRAGVTGLGHDTNGLQLFPKRIENHQSHGESEASSILDNRFRIRKLVTCGFHAAFITTEGALFTWGQGRFGRLGFGSEANVNIPTMLPQNYFDEKIVDVSCGGFHTACITESGRLFIWGGGEHGQLGFSDKKNYLVPQCLPGSIMLANVQDKLYGSEGIVKVKQVVCGWSHTSCSIAVFLREELVCSSLVFSWGNNDHGKLGLGDKRTVVKPVHLHRLNGYEVKQLASYNEHTLALCQPQQLQVIENSLSKDLGSMFNSDDFCDITFVVEGKEVKAHRVILSARSDHFRAMFSSTFLEASQQVIHIGDKKGNIGPYVTFATFSAFLYYLYTDSVKLFEDLQDGKALVKLCVIADFYAAESLKEKCLVELRKIATESNAPVILQEAFLQGSTVIEEEWLDYILDNFEVVSKVDSFALLDKSLILRILQKR